MKCEACAAPLPPGTAKCAYCGTLADLDALGTRADPTQQADHPRACSGCGEQMETVNLRTDERPFFIERCPSCLGIFLDTGEIEAILDEKIGTVSSIDRRALRALQDHRGEDSVVYRRCPVCTKLMNRENFGGGSGVVVDACKKHGIYLDVGELRRIVAWVGAGGRLAAIEAGEAKRASAVVHAIWETRGGLDQSPSSDENEFVQVWRFLARIFR